jgi:hypothetical protein
MDKHRTRVVPWQALVLVGVLALILGSLGTAVAGPALTKKNVRKIAAKVVRKSAPTLSVARAGDAANLAGQPPSSYFNTALVFSTSTESGALTHTVVIPLAPGSYSIGYSVVLLGGSGYSYCQVVRSRPANPALIVADDTSEVTGGPSISGYGAVDVRAGDTVTLRCTSATGFTIPAAQPAQIVVTPVASTLATATPLVAA